MAEVWNGSSSFIPSTTKSRCTALIEIAETFQVVYQLERILFHIKVEAGIEEKKLSATIRTNPLESGQRDHRKQLFIIMSSIMKRMEVDFSTIAREFIVVAKTNGTSSQQIDTTSCCYPIL